MATGTGLPIPKSGEVVSLPGVLSGGDGGAAAWGQIANAGARIEASGLDVLGVAEYQRRLGTAADLENDARKTATDLSVQYHNDPKAFETHWQAYQDGKLAGADPRDALRVRHRLDQIGSAHYASISASKLQEDTRLDAERVKTLTTTSANDVITMGTAGTLMSPMGEAAISKLRSQLDAGVAARLHTQEHADATFDETLGKAQSELAANVGVKTYKEEGYEAAIRKIQTDILDNEDLKLSLTQRHSAFNRAKAAIENERRIDQQDRAGIVDSANDLIKRIATQQVTDPGEIQDMRVALKRANAPAALAKLEVAVQASTYKGLGPAAGAQAVRTLRGASFGPQVDSIIENEAKRVGLDPNLLRRIVQIESGGDPYNVTGRYKGMLQISDAQHAAEGKQGSIFDPAENLRVGSQIIAREAANFRTKYGREPTATDIYMLHQQGPGGYANHLANPTAPAWQNMAATAEGREKGERWAKAAIWGNLSDKDKARFGSVENVSSAQFVEVWRAKVEGGGPPGPIPGVASQYAGRVTAAVQNQWVAETKRDWPQYKEAISQGRPLDPADLNALRYAAQLSGDPHWQREVEAYAVAHEAAQALKPLVAGDKQAAMDQLKADLEAAGVPVPDQDTLMKGIAAAADRDVKIARESPVDYHVENRGAPPSAFSPDSQESMVRGMAERMAIAHSVAASQGVPVGNPIREKERDTLAATITGGKVQQASNVITGLSTIPHPMVDATFGGTNNPLTDALVGASTSSDPARMVPAMSTLDKFWKQDPAKFKSTFGEQALKNLQVWQGKKDFMSPAEIAEDFVKARDPAVVKARQSLDEPIKHELSKVTIREVLGGFNPSFLSFGPSAPLNIEARGIDGLMQERLMAEHNQIYGELRKEGVPADQALKRTNDRLSSEWGVSSVNVNTVMRLPPERYYPAVDGSHSWITDQIRTYIEKAKGIDIAENIIAVSGAGLGGLTYAPEADMRFRGLVPDSQTESEIARRVPPSYRIIITNAQTGRDEVLVAPSGNSRFTFDPTEAQQTYSQRLKRQHEFAVSQKELGVGEAGLLPGEAARQTETQAQAQQRRISERGAGVRHLGRGSAPASPAGTTPAPGTAVPPVAGLQPDEGE